MAAFRDTPIKRKFTLVTMLTSGAALVLACVVFVAHDLFRFRDAIVQEQTARARVIAANSASALVFKFPDAASDTLKSLAQQHYPGEFEVIVIDDGSKDATAAIVEDNPYPWLRLMRQSHNMGKAAALNRGLAESRHDYVITLDADSYLYGDALQRLVERYFNDPATTKAVAGTMLVRNSRKNWAPGRRTAWRSGSAPRRSRRGAQGSWKPAVRAVSLNGRERVVLRLPEYLSLQDVGVDGSVLLTVGAMRSEVIAGTRAEARERNLSWHEGSSFVEMSRDGRHLLFFEAVELATYLRPTDGGPAVRLCEGLASALSPDGAWVVRIGMDHFSGRFTLLPTGAGEPRVVPGPRMLFLNWLPTYLVQARGYTLVKMGFFASLPWLAALISSNGPGWLSDALVKRGFSTGKARRTLIYFGAPAMAASLWLATQTGNAEAAVGLITVTILLAGLNFPAFWSLPMDMNVQKAGFITGMMNTGSALASIVAPGVTGYVAMWFGWTAAHGLGSVLALLSAIVMYLAAPKATSEEDPALSRS